MKTILACLPLAAAAALPPLHGAVAVPYFDDFSSYGAAATANTSANSISAFTENNTAAFAVYTRTANDASTNYLRGNIQSISTSSAVLAASNASGGSDFSVSTKARAATLNVGASAGGGPATTMTFSLIAATGLANPSADPAASGTSNITSTYYSLTLDYLAGTIALTKSGTSIGTGSGTTGSTWFSTSATFLTFTLTGVYNSGGIDLVGTITDGTDTYTINATDSDPLTGGYFGYRTTKNGNTSTVNGTQSQLTTQMDDFSLAVVPEPSSLLLAGAMSTAGFLRRNRRK